MQRHPRPMVLALLAIGCGSAGDQPAVVVADSAGITIVRNAIELETLPEHRLGGTPVIDLGAVDGGPPYQFFRVMDGLRLGDGRIAVLNAGSAELRFYDAQGRFLSAHGGEGEGPGEYRFPYRLLRLPGDSLLLYDLALARFTVLDPSGEVARMFTPSRPLLNEPEFAGLMGDSVVVIHETLYDIPAAGFDTMYTRVAFIDLVGDGADSLMVPDARMGRIGSAERRFVGRPHFEPRTSLTADANGLWIGTGRGPQVSRYDVRGQLNRIVRWDGQPIPVTEEDVTRRIETMVAEAGDRDPEVRSRYRDVPAAEEFPFYDQLESDPRGRLWVRLFDATGTGQLHRWLIFDSAGRLVGHANLPGSMDVLEIGEDYLLGVQRDDFDVEHVRLWTLGSG